MTREARANLIFFVILLAATLPGAVILFKKKLDPDAPRTFLPGPPPRTTAYIDPGPIPPSITPVVPQTVSTWTASLRGSTSTTRPVISNHRAFEIVDAQTTSQSCEIFIIVWKRGSPDEDTKVAAELEVGGKRIAGKSRDVGPITLPGKVLASLQQAGYPRSPSVVLGAKFFFPVAIPESGATFHISAEIEDQRISDSVQLFTNPLRTKI